MSGGTGTPTETPVREHATFARLTDSINRFILQGFVARRLEVEDIHFNLDSAVMLPDHTTPDSADRNRVTGLAILRTAYLHAQQHQDQRLLIAGHTDRSGPADYNLTLSELRATNVEALVRNQQDRWADISHRRHIQEDVHAILRWADRTFGWDSRPGVRGLRAAIRQFKTRFNESFDPDVPVNDQDDLDLWKAFFACYQRELVHMLGTTEIGLASLQAQIRFLDSGSPTVGCGENHPVTSAYLSRIDRRVELLFFRDVEQPNLACHPGAGTCDPSVCEIYGPNAIYRIDRIDPDDWARLTVHLKLLWRDPAGTARPMPEGLAGTVVLGGKATDTMNVVVGPEGLLDFTIDRRKKSFTIRFTHATRSFVSSAPIGAVGPEQLATEADAPAQVQGGRRVWELPKEWSLETTDWAVPAGGVDPTAAPFTNGSFTELDDPSLRVGNDGAPAELTLDPHWQFFRMVWFDRGVRRRTSILPSVFEGFAVAADGDDPAKPPDTLSNWTTRTGDAARQALPWILRRDGAGASSSRPDANGLLRYRSLPNTFLRTAPPVAAAAAARTVVTSQPAAGPPAAPPAVGINAGANLVMDLTVPQSDRLLFYDLPAVWKSRRYHARPAASGDAAPIGAAGQPYESVAGNPTSDAAPLVFSLDDLVLFDGDPATNQITQPSVWNATDRLALLVNRFSNRRADGTVDPNLTLIGVFKPATATFEPFYSTVVPTVLDPANNRWAYIVDYPDWTRLATARGNIHDAFDQRTPDGADGVVGARAAVKWQDVTGLPSSSPGNRIPTPPAISTRFLALQAFFQSTFAVYEHRPVGTGVTLRGSTANFKIGRMDLVAIRCCDRDGATEVAMNLHYLRLDFAFPAAATAPRTPSGIPAAIQPRFALDAINNIMTRWNGGDNRGGGMTIQEPGLRPAVRFAMRWFGQRVPNAEAHFRIDVFRPVARAGMESTFGQGELKIEDNPGPWVLGPPPTVGGPPAAITPRLTIAHEAGHADSLPDEYTETSAGATYRNSKGLFSFLLGGPYDRDDLGQHEGMMEGNFDVRARYGWPAAEWIRRSFPAENLNLNVFQEASAVASHAYRYSVPRHPNNTLLFSTEPWASRTNVRRGNRGRFDAFLYVLGDDEYSHAVLGKAKLAADAVRFFDGILKIVVKLRIVVFDNSQLKVQKALDDFERSVKANLDRWVISGTARGRRFDRCWLQVDPRFLVAQFPSQAGDAAFRTRYLNGLGVTTQAGWQTKVQEIAQLFPPHFSIFAKDGGNTRWAPPRPADPTFGFTFDVEYDSDDESDIAALMAEMLGVNDGATDRAPEFAATARAVFTTATAVDVDTI